MGMLSYPLTNDWEQGFHMKKKWDVPVDKALLFAVEFTFLGQWQGELKSHNHKEPLQTVRFDQTLSSFPF